MAKPKTPAPAKVPEIVDKDPLGIGQEPAAKVEGSDDKPGEGEVIAEAISDAVKDGVIVGAETLAEKIGQAFAGNPPETIPPAPGDEPDAVMDRRLARLTQLVEDAEFESGTAFGDLRDCLLDLFKARPPIAWSAMRQSEQQDVARAIEAAVKMALQKIVVVIAEEDSLTVAGTLLGQFSVKGETLEVKVKIDHADESVVVDVYKMAGHKVVLVSADDKRFMSAKRDVPIQPDQLGLGFADDKPTKAPTEIKSDPPAHPADDSDLAGEEDATRTHGDESAVDDEEAEEEAPEEEPTATGTHRVYDAGEKVYLMADGQWDDSLETAGSWPLDVATSLAEQEEATVVEVGAEPKEEEGA